VAALVATVLSGIASTYLLWWEFRGFEMPKFDVPPTNQKDAEQNLKNLEQQMKYIQNQTLWLSLYQTAATVLDGMFLISVPLLLRAFCRTLRLKEPETNCDGLLKIGGALLAIGLGTRVLGLFLLSLLMVVSWLGSLLHLAWTVLYLLLLAQIWRAIPARR
jgi:hypothetical protein